MFRYVLLTLRLVLDDDCGRPYANREYLLEIEGEPPRVGRTGRMGNVEILCPPLAEEALLRLPQKGGLMDDPLSVFKLKLGFLDDCDQTSGLQARLNNLGLFASTQVDNQQDERFVRAVSRFQELCQFLFKRGLAEDRKTRERLAAVHDAYGFRKEQEREASRS